jgi:sugar phosphate isomerase/epimerase
MHLPPVALQLWSVRTEAGVDFARTVAQVSALGYRGVELAGYGNLDVHGAKRAILDAGLVVAGMHLTYAKLASDLNQAIEDALLLGTKDVTCAIWPSSHYISASACERIGERLAELGSSFRAAGLRFSFHNHAPELKIIAGRTVLDWMFGASAPRDLAIEADVFWLHVGGCAPERFLRAYGSRCPLIHLRDEAELGRGPVNFQEVFAAIDDVAAAEWLIVEQDQFNHEPLESVRLCLEQLKAWGRA